jgi:hypothetical protein
VELLIRAEAAPADLAPGARLFFAPARFKVYPTGG